MVLRCAWGTCNADERYPERLEGGFFVRFPTVKRNSEKCKRWIKACGRPHDQLNLSRINQHKAVCSKHFVGAKGPSTDYPDPVPADGACPKPVRRPPLKRLSQHSSFTQTKKLKSSFVKEKTDIEDTEATDTAELVTDPAPKIPSHMISTATQTDDTWISAMDMLALAAEKHGLQQQLEDKSREINKLKTKVAFHEQTIDKLKSDQQQTTLFSIEVVMNRGLKISNLFQHYTGVTYVRFLALLTFLLPQGAVIDYSSGRKDIKKLTSQNALLLTLCRLRHGFGLKDIAVRFGLSPQSAGIVFNTWLDVLYFKLGQIPIWPHRDDIIKQMPDKYRKDYPTTLIIIDGTEVKTQTPSALRLKSQVYSDYKSSSTLKGLIGCDPNGSLMFVSELFTGSVSDKAITEQSGFYNVIKSLKENGYIEKGDGIMVDKGFQIKKEIEELELQLNIPPMGRMGKQFNMGENLRTEKVAKHRVHIERLINKVKQYKLLSNCVPTSLFSRINKIWSVCCHLTLFQDVFVKK